MTEPIRTPTLAESVRIAIRAAQEEQHTHLPGVIVKYDATRQVADVQPLLKRRVELEDGVTEARSLPVLPDVPIIFPGTGPDAGDLRIMLPLRVGSRVLLLFMEASTDVWQQSGGEVDPNDPRRFHLSDAVAIPGINPYTAPLQGAEDGVISIGSNTGASEFVATANRVLVEMNKLRTAFNSHTHGPGTFAVVSAPGPVTAGTSSGTPAAAPSLVAPASATVKIRG